MTASASNQQKFVRAARRVASEPHLSVLQAQMLLGSEVPDWSNHDAIADLKRTFSEGSLTATILTPAPQHEQSSYSGDIKADRAWWDGAWNAASQDGGDWNAWFFNTGIAVAASAVRNRIARINRDHVLAAERARALAAAPFTWDLPQALLWVASRDDSRVERIRANLLLPNPADCRTSVETLEHELGGPAAAADSPSALNRLIEDPWNELASALHAGEVSGFAYYAHTADRPEIAAAAFVNAHLDLTSKSYGLLPQRLGVANILFNKNKVRSRWPAESADSRLAGHSARNDLLAFPGAPSEPCNGSGYSRVRPAEPWTEKQMTDAIRAYCTDTGINEREVAWNRHFKALEHETGWNNTNFRAHWSKARDTEGKQGRPTKSA